jgi:hypothetical protein
MMNKLLPTLASCCLAGGLVFSTAGLASATKTLKFQVFLDEKPIGTHRFSLQERDEGLLSESRAAFDVNFLFINAYRYRHQSRELWQDGCLKKLEATTDNNGERYSVRGTPAASGFLVEGETESQVQDPCAMTFAYWDKRILEQDRLINPQTGEVVDVAVTDEGLDRITVDGREVDARRYRLTAEGLDIRLWYDDSQRWLGLESRIEDQYRLSYRPIGQ